MEKFFSCNFSGKNIYGGLILLFIAIVSIAVFSSGAVHPVSDHFAAEDENKGQDTIHDVRAVAETTPVPRGEREDAADDPAIWIHPNTPDSSRIIGTDKKGGLSVYNLEGKELFYYGDGKMNNADLRYEFELTDRTTDILAVSNRTDNSINLYAINRNGFLKKIHKRLLLTKMADEVYGLCMYKSPLNNKFYVFINNKEGDIEQWELFEDGNLVNGKIVRKLKLDTQVEGMVADDESATLFVGEENVGIWKFNAEPDAPVIGTLLPFSSETTNKNIRFDIEGLAIYSLPNGKGYLISSSQGNDSFAVFRREIPHSYLGSFRIVDGVVDGVEGTDGIEVTNVPLGKNFPNGLLVVHDGSNKDNGESVPQNYKLVSWDSVAVKFNPPLEVR